jgi:uncharacterized protein involved in high-affinity Fe2+ transport
MAATQIPSDEADAQQLDMARAEGEAYHASLEYMAHKVADNGATQEAGDYLVGIAQERAEGMYHLTDGELVWHEAGDHNCHLEVSVSDRADHRFVPALSITASLTAENGKTIGPVEVPFLWHPGLYHYGINLKLPGDGLYDIAVHIEPPTFMRHDKINGRRYADPVHVTFKGFKVKTGKE